MGFNSGFKGLMKVAVTAQKLNDSEDNIQ